MAGHSKWANIKRRKGAQDAQRGKIFSKLNREIMVSAKLGGGDPDANPRLRLAINKARSANMPMDNIDRAIKKGTGDLEGVSYEEITYEGYGPAGVAILVETMTDNRKRTVSEVRHLFSKYSGNLGETGCVAWIFQMASLFIFSEDEVDPDQLVEVALEAGAEDIKEEDGEIEVTAPPDQFQVIKDAFDEAQLSYQLAEVTMIPQNTVALEGKKAEQALRLVEALEESDDVQRVFANFDIPEDVLESI
jgi:YebC/PmpR family DNA-binding regulatory protein